VALPAEDMTGTTEATINAMLAEAINVETIEEMIEEASAETTMIEGTDRTVTDVNAVETGNDRYFSKVYFLCNSYMVHS
jgi:hypothetical protein